MMKLRSRTIAPSSTELLKSIRRRTVPKHKEKQPIGINVSADGIPLSSLEMNILLQEFNCGTYKLKFWAVSERQTTMHSLMELMRIDGPKKSSIRHFSKGSYAYIYKFNTTISQQFVLKVADYDDDDMFSGPFVESFLLRYLFRQFVLTGLTPHLPMTLSSTRSLGRKEVLTLCEFAQYRSLYYFLPTAALTVTNTECVVRLILFQIAYTLAWIQHIHPNFRHNDTRLPNILIARAPDRGYSEYHAPDGSVFHVPNCGIRAILWDFDMSSIVGLADNSRVYRFEVENTDFGISSAGDPGYDIYQLARLICMRLKTNLHFQQTRVLADMRNIWRNTGLLEDLEVKTPQVRMPRWQCTLPTPLQLLSGTLFSEYSQHTESSEATYVFGSKNLSLPFLSPDEVVEMMTIQPSDLPDTYLYSIPLGFGAPETVQAMFLSIPSAQVYNKLHLLLDNSFPYPVTQPVESEQCQKNLVCYAQWITEILQDSNFPMSRREEKVHIVIEGVVRILTFLQVVQQRYFNLILLLAIFLEGEPVATTNFMCDINAYSTMRYTHDVISIAFMQYKWIKLMLETYQ